MDQEGKFEVIQELGRGSFGSVVLARIAHTGERVAIKKIKRAHLQPSTYNDILNNSQLRHPHMVQFREVFVSPEHVNIVMDYVNGGSLFTYVQSRNRLREPLARWFFQQLMLAVYYCHRKGLANIDIRLENILLQVIPGLPRPLVKLGYREQGDMYMPDDRITSLTYASPEAMLGNVFDGQAADIWSCGVVLYTMLVGRYPFRAAAHEALPIVLLKKMRNQEYGMPDSLNLTPDCKDLISKLLNPDIETRIKMSDVFQHPWFRTNLPPEALDMNDIYLAKSSTCAPDEVMAEIAAATKVTQEAADRVE